MQLSLLHGLLPIYAKITGVERTSCSDTCYNVGTRTRTHIARSDCSVRGAGPIAILEIWRETAGRLGASFSRALDRRKLRAGHRDGMLCTRSERKAGYEGDATHGALSPIISGLSIGPSR